MIIPYQVQPRLALVGWDLYCGSLLVWAESAGQVGIAGVGSPLLVGDQNFFLDKEGPTTSLLLNFAVRNVKCILLDFTSSNKY